MKRIKESHFYKTLLLIKSKPKLIFLMVLFDILFFASIYYSANLITLILQKLTLNNISNRTLSFFLLALSYILLLIFIYSFFKYCILGFIKSLKKKVGFNFKKLAKFYLLNLIILISAFIIFVAVYSLIKIIFIMQFAKIILLSFFVAYLILINAFINLSHIFFIKEDNVGDILKKSSGFLFRFRYILIYVNSFLVFLGFYVIYYLLVLIFKSLILSYYQIYFTVFTILTSIVIYLIFILFNRIYFYEIMGKSG